MEFQKALWRTQADPGGGGISEELKECFRKVPKGFLSSFRSFLVSFMEGNHRGTKVFSGSLVRGSGQ